MQGHRDLRVRPLAYASAMELLRETKTFPKEERYFLTEQMRRSSRRVTAHTAEAFRKRQ